MRKPHLDLLALAPRPLKVRGANERSGDVAGMLMDIARDLARWFFWTALRFERAYIAVELAGAIQKRLALMHGATCSKLLSAWAVVDVAGRVISKVAAREGAIISPEADIGLREFAKGISRAPTGSQSILSPRAWTTGVQRTISAARDCRNFS